MWIERLYHVELGTLIVGNASNVQSANGKSGKPELLAKTAIKGHSKPRGVFGADMKRPMCMRLSRGILVDVTVSWSPIGRQIGFSVTDSASI
jgi:hypothetical protein